MEDLGFDFLRRISLINTLLKASSSYFLQNLNLPIYYFSADHKFDIKAQLRSTMGDNIIINHVKGSNHSTIVKDPNHAKELAKQVSKMIRGLDSNKANVNRRKGVASQSIVNFQLGKKEVTPLYCIPGAGGAIGGLIQLSNHIDDRIPISGIVPRGLENSVVPHTTVEAAAAYYVNMICQAETQNTFNLLGYSYGGWVALEVANQLSALGYKVDHVILLDVSPPSHSLDRNLGHPRSFALDLLIKQFEMQASKSFNLSIKEMGTWSEEKQTTTILDKAKEMKILPHTTSLEDFRRMIQLFLVNANTAYIPTKTYDGRVLLAQTSEDQDNSLLKKNLQEWKKHLSNLEVAQVKGNHTSMLVGSNAKDLGRIIMNFMTEINASKKTLSKDKIKIIR